MNDLTLRTIDDADMPLLTKWLHRDYVRTWFHDPEDWLDEIRGRHDRFAWLHHFIVMADKIPIGFCQYYDCFEAPEDWYTVTQGGDTYSIDYLIGNEDYLGKGYGKAIIRLLTSIVQERERARRIIVQPERENLASSHVLLANGYLYDDAKGFYYRTLDLGVFGSAP